MQRRSFIKSTGIFAALISTPFFNLKAQNQMKKINFRHVVYFWLNDPENISQKKQFLTNITEFIENMENIQDAFIGIPAETPREVVDNSYQFSLILGFKNKTEQDTYQEHPLHKQFIDKTAHLWKRVVVYDSIPAK
jgi:hypothetical protein